jgi:drug/metabolite transporter (DMT)-like permease
MNFSSQTLKGIVYACIAGGLFGAEYLAISWVFNTSTESFSTLSITAINFFGAFLMALLFLGWNKNIWKRSALVIKNHSKPLITIAGIISLGIFLLFYAVTHSSAGSTSLLERTQLLFIIALGVFFLGEKLNKKELLGIFISLIGFIGISTFPTDLSPVVIFCVLLAALLYALQSFIIKKYVPNVDGLGFGFVRVGLVGSILMIVFFSLEGLSPSHPSLFEMLILAIAGFFGTFVSRYFYFEAHNLLPISFLNVFVLLEAVVVVLGEMIFFDFVPFSWTKIIAGSIILLGLAILSFSKKED